MLAGNCLAEVHESTRLPRFLNLCTSSNRLPGQKPGGTPVEEVVVVVAAAVVVVVIVVAVVVVVVVVVEVVATVGSFLFAGKVGLVCVVAAIDECGALFLHLELAELVGVVGRCAVAAFVEYWRAFENWLFGILQARLWKVSSPTLKQVCLLACPDTPVSAKQPNLVRGMCLVRLPAAPVAIHDCWACFLDVVVQFWSVVVLSPNVAPVMGAMGPVCLCVQSFLPNVVLACALTGGMCSCLS